MIVRMAPIVNQIISNAPMSPLRVALITLLALVSTTAPVLGEVIVFTQDQPRILKWTTATERRGGIPLHPDDIAYYEIDWQCDASGSGKVRAYYPAEFITMPDHWLGLCSATIITVDTLNQPSVPSEPTHFLIKLNKPQRGGLR